MESAISSIRTLSRELIKPSSSQTPQHNTKLKLSYLDQLVASMYTPLIFFFQPNYNHSFTDSSHISKHLKQSLSHTLTSFYPVGGSIDTQDPSFIDCDRQNDEMGIELIEARAPIHLVDAINKNRDQDIDMHQYLPVDPTCCKRGLVTIKITFFECGGMCIGICFSHRLIDFGSMMGFINAWASTSRGEINFSPYNFDLATHFPAKHHYDAVFMPSYDDNCVAKRFLFDEETLTALKQQATSPLVTNPTKVEAVSAFIWKHLIEVAAKPNGTKPKSLLATQLLSLRKRSRSLENVFGNCIMVTAALHDPNRNVAVSDQLYHELVSKMRNSIAKINEDYIMKARSEDNYMNDIDEIISILTKGEAERCGFSSWCKYPLYEVDFGWGKPYWVSTTRVPATNTTALIDTKCGTGIEVWVNMQEEKLQTLGNKIQLISKLAKGMD